MSEQKFYPRFFQGEEKRLRKLDEKIEQEKQRKAGQAEAKKRPEEERKLVLEKEIHSIKGPVVEVYEAAQERKRQIVALSAQAKKEKAKEVHDVLQEEEEVRIVAEQKRRHREKLEQEFLGAKKHKAHRKGFKPRKPERETIRGMAA